MNSLLTVQRVKPATLSQLRYFLQAEDPREEWEEPLRMPKGRSLAGFDPAI